MITSSKLVSRNQLSVTEKLDSTAQKMTISSATGFFIKKYAFASCSKKTSNNGSNAVRHKHC